MKTIREIDEWLKGQKPFIALLFILIASSIASVLVVSIVRWVVVRWM